VRTIVRLALTLTVAAAALPSFAAPTEHYVAYVQTGTFDPDHSRKKVQADFGTDAQVSIVLHGSKADTAPIPLSTGRVTDFDAGNVDVFTFETPPLGELKSLRIGHDGTGPAPDWYLDWVVIRNETTGETYYFRYDGWLGRTTALTEVESSTTLSPSVQPDPKVR
jgi:hypothetical protein